MEEETIELYYGNEREGAKVKDNKTKIKQKILELFDTEEIEKVEILYKEKENGIKIKTDTSVATDISVEIGSQELKKSILENLANRNISAIETNIQAILNNINGLTLGEWEILKKEIDNKFKETAKLNLSNEELKRFEEYLHLL